MAFLYPDLFPALCVTETNSDPKNIRFNGYQVYPVEMNLDQAMALVWKPNKFNIETSFTVDYDFCSGECIYLTGEVSGQSDNNSEHANFIKMSDLVCLQSYYPEYGLEVEISVPDDCEGHPRLPILINSFLGIYINTIPVIEESFPIYSYNGKYYLCMFYAVGLGLANLYDDSPRVNAGNLTINFGNTFPFVREFQLPIYLAEGSPVCNSPVASGTFTMISDRLNG